MSLSARAANATGRALIAALVACLSIVALVAASSRVFSQADPAAVGIESDEGLEAMRSRIFAFVKALGDYTEDVRLDAAVLERILASYHSLGEILGGGEDGAFIERAFRDGRYDFDVIVRDPAYEAWCRDRELQPERFFEGLLRLEALRMRAEGLPGLEQARAELPGRKAELERLRDRLGEEAYREGLAALEQAAAMVEETRDLMAGLPLPSAEEQALLDENRERIRTTLGEDGPR
jgi:hypothetical protein